MSSSLTCVEAWGHSLVLEIVAGALALGGHLVLGVVVHVIVGEGVPVGHLEVPHGIITGEARLGGNRPDVVDRLFDRVLELVCGRHQVRDARSAILALWW